MLNRSDYMPTRAVVCITIQHSGCWGSWRKVVLERRVWGRCTIPPSSVAQVGPCPSTFVDLWAWDPEICGPGFLWPFHGPHLTMAIKPEALCRFHPECANVVPRVQVCLGSKAVNTCCLALPITNPGEKICLGLKMVLEWNLETN